MADQGVEMNDCQTETPLSSEIEDRTGEIRYSLPTKSEKQNTIACHKCVFNSQLRRTYRWLGQPQLLHIRRGDQTGLTFVADIFQSRQNHKAVSMQLRSVPYGAGNGNIGCLQ